MITERITISKSAVYDEVAKTTSYIGKKKFNDNATGYMRMFTTDADQLMLERFWSEACNVATDLMKPFIVDVNHRPDSYVEVASTDDYTVLLQLPENFSTSLTSSMCNSLFNYFMSAIVGKWCKFTNNEESETYLQEASRMLNDARSKLYYRNKPTRVPVE